MMGFRPSSLKPFKRKQVRVKRTKKAPNFNAGVGVDNGLGVNGGFQVGNPLNSNILVPVIIGLGLLSFFNIVLTVLTPLFSKTSKSDTDAAETPATPADAARMSRNMMYMANNVMEAIEKFKNQYQD
eukprot:TCALIF_08709-PA protein Name:"Protein of unknown function" AED:0.44 eAED:0.44 QI:0/0/0.5/0.5/1/1/2/119/126